MTLDDAEDDVLATLDTFNRLFADLPQTNEWAVDPAGWRASDLRPGRALSGQRLHARGDRGTLGVEIDDVHRLIARHRIGAEYAVDEQSGSNREVRDGTALQ